MVTWIVAPRIGFWYEVVKNNLNSLLRWDTKGVPTISMVGPYCMYFYARKPRLQSGGTAANPSVSGIYWRNGMNASQPNSGERVRDLHITDDSLAVDLSDGRTINCPLSVVSATFERNTEQRSRSKISGAGDGIHWPDVDEDLSTEGLLGGGRLRLSELAGGARASGVARNAIR